jgi:2,4-dienoyl-CoA reductase-like NADH-dependent reductase (Old Yellow Enzyme family)
VGWLKVGLERLFEPTLHGRIPHLPWKDEQVDGLARVAEAVHRHGCKLACQLLHPGLRAVPVLKKDPAYDFDAEWYLVAPSQVPPGEYPNAPMPKELEEHEIEALLAAYADAARRAVAAGLDGVEYHMSHGYLPCSSSRPCTTTAPTAGAAHTRTGCASQSNR